MKSQKEIIEKIKRYYWKDIDVNCYSDDKWETNMDKTLKKALNIQRAEFEKEIDEKLDYLEQTLPDKSGRTTEEDEIVETLEELKQMLKEKA